MPTSRDDRVRQAFSEALRELAREADVSNAIVTDSRHELMCCATDLVWSSRPLDDPRVRATLTKWMPIVEKITTMLPPDDDPGRPAEASAQRARREP